MAYYVYSFSDVTMTLRHSALGSLTIDGSGATEVTITNDGDRSTKQVAADGTTLINKIRDRTATMSISLLQGAEFHNTLVRWFNWLEEAASDQWAGIVCTIRSRSTRELINLEGVAFQKVADKAFAAQGRDIQWNFLVADIQHESV